MVVGGGVPIEQLRPGDKILAFDPADPQGRLVTTTLRSVVRVKVDETLELTAGSYSLRVTPDHPCYVGRGVFRLAGALGVGDILLVRDGSTMDLRTITAIRVIREPIVVYNLQADPPHTFFAGGVAVHNKGGGGFGGGGHFGGGGFGGGFGGYHGGFGGGGANPMDANSAVVLLIVFGAVIAVVLVNALNASRDHDRQNLDFVYSTAAVARKMAKTHKLLEFIAQQDSAMAPDALAKLALGTFTQLQKCWQARDYTPMKPLLMPDLYAQHVTQLSAMAAQHEINMIAALRIERVDLVNVRYTEKADTREFTALITASARDYYIDDRTREFLRGDQEAARFQEFWTFQLHGGAWLLREVEQSRESEVLKQENFFEAMTDQTLAGIYGGQAGAAPGSGPTSGGGPAGPWTDAGISLKSSRIDRLLNFLVVTDKMWNRDLLLERARQVFVAVAAARQSGDPNLAPAGDLFPDVAEHLRAEITSRAAEGVTWELRNCCAVPQGGADPGAALCREDAR